MVRKTQILILVILAAAVAFTGLACSDFGSSNGGSRFSPSINRLRLSRTSIFCDLDFTVSFDHFDPQDDINNINFSFIGDDNPGVFQDNISWGDERVDLETEPGRAIVTYSLDCDLEMPDGDYTFKVFVEDEKDHQSNDLVTEIRLL
jgi:hypothetical protein